MTYTVNLLSRFKTRPTYVACQAVLHTLLYLDNTVEHGIVFTNHTDEEEHTRMLIGQVILIPVARLLGILCICGVHQWHGNRDYVNSGYFDYGG